MSRAKIVCMLLVPLCASISPGQANVNQVPSRIASEQVVTEKDPGPINTDELYRPARPAQRARGFYSMSQFFFLLLLCAPPAIICNALAGQKGKNRAVWTIVGIIPFIGFYGMLYLIGSHNEIVLDKLNDVLVLLTEKKQQNLSPGI